MVIEILATIEIVEEDRPGQFSSWLDARLDGLAAGLGSEARRRAITLHDGGPRSRARSPGTARACLRSVLPALLAWSAGYDHLREVTRDDVLGHLAGLHAHERYSAVSALRSLFTWAKQAGVIFRNPRPGSGSANASCRSGSRWTPGISPTLRCGDYPASRVYVVLAAVHAARPGAAAR